MSKTVIFLLAVLGVVVSADQVSVCIKSSSGAYMSASTSSSVTGVSSCSTNEKWTIFEDDPFYTITHDALSAGLPEGQYYFLSGYTGGKVDLTQASDNNLLRYQTWKRSTNSDGTVSYANYDFTLYPWEFNQVPPEDGPSYLSVSSGSAGLAETIGDSEKF